MKVKLQLNTIDNVRAKAKKLSTYADIIDRLETMRNCNYGNTITDAETGEITDIVPWEGLEIEFEDVNDVINLIYEYLT